MKSIRKIALINALLTTFYIILIGIFFYYASEVKLGKDNQFLAPIAMLLLFVSSAAITGYLVIGRPLQLYIDGKKKDALTLLFNTF